ncbi:peptidase S74 [Bacillus cereus]|uniref:phage tail spike protein n=1 Tax=Bacillus cereus TaxID=1396 RepID=UPI000BFE7C71|nr:phage tail spike protein [Bacillus cereus]PGZ08897.1 peptidase S74 [Bacillus cereus]
MRTPSGDLHIVDFKTSQIVSDIQPKDYWDDKRHWEIKNNIDTLEFRVFENTEHAATLVQQNLVLKEVRGGSIVPYVITEVEKDSGDRSLMVYASGEWIQLAKAAIIEPQKIESKTLKQCMEIALKGTKWEIGKTEHDGAHSFTVDEFIDPLNLLKKIAVSFELEIQYRAEVVGSQIVGRYVDMVKKRGRDTRKEVTLGKDLMGIKRIENSQNICTALLGYVKKENGEFITISEINNGVPYFVDDAAYQRWNEKGKHKFAFYTPQTEDQDMSPQRLMTLMKTEMNKLVNTSVSYEVRVQSIGRVFGLAHELINEGDTIRIIDTGFTPKLYLEARAIAGDESFKDPTQDKYMFGDYREIVDQNDELRRLYQKILSSLYDKVPQELFDQLKDQVNEQNEAVIEAKDKADQAQKESQVAKDLAEATQDYMEKNLVDIIESVKPPTTDLKANKTLWRDISNGKPGILKIWTGTAWDPVVPDVESVKKETLEQVNKDIESTKIELNQKVQEAQNQATEQFNEVKENLQGISRTISNIENKQGEIDKKVTKFEQDANGFKTSIESLTKKDSEISDKLNTVESTVEGTKKTISEVQLTTNDLKKTTTEIKEEAGKTNEKLEQVTGTVNNLEVGATNLIDGTEFVNANGWVKWGNYGEVNIIDQQTLKPLPTRNSLLMHTQVGGKQQVVPINEPVGLNGTGHTFKMKKDQKFTVSMNVATSELGYLLDFVHVMHSDGKGNVKLPVIDTTKFPIVAVISNRLNNNYFRVKFTFTADRDDDDAYLLIAGKTKRALDGANGYAWIRINALQLEKGTLASDWDTSKGDKVSLQAFETKTTEIEKSVDGVKTTVTSVQNSQVGFEKRINTVEQTVDKNSQAITTLSTTQGKQGELIQSNKSSIEQLNNEIKLKVTETQMEDYIGAIGHVNMVSNSAFEERTIDPTTGIVTQTKPSIAKWEVRGTNATATVLPVSARNHGGYNSVKIENSGQAGTMFTSINQTMPIVSGSGAYIFSVWIYTDNASGIDEGGAIEMTFRNGSTQVSSKLTYFDKTLANNTWTQLSVKLDAPTQPANVVNVRLYVRKNGRVWLSQPMVVQGTELSTFMENPKDITNYDQLIGEVAKKVATSEFNSKVTTMETNINQNTKAISLRAEKTEVYNKIDSDGRYGSKVIVDRHESELKIQSNEISLRVQKGDIASTINQTAQKVLIQADKIYLDGFIEAKHLKAQTLQGVTIQTAPSGSGANQIRLNAQNMTLYGSGQARGYFGFINRTDSNITSALVLGNDYASSGSLDGSLVLDQTTINGSQWTNSVASIGIATGRNGNDIAKKSYINFYRYTGNMDIRSEGSMELLTTNGDIELDASSSGSLNGFVYIKASKDIEMIAKRGQYRFFTTDNFSTPTMTLVDRKPTSSGDVDLTLGNLLMLRLSRNVSYVGDGLQIKDATGSNWRDMKLRTLRAMENISAVGRMWASEFVPTSSRKLKTDIQDLPFSALDKINSVNIKQYHMIRDVERFNSGEAITLPVNYGMIAEESDDVFTTVQKDAVTLYSTVSISIQAIQELDFKVENLHFDQGMLKQEVEALQLENEELAKRVEQLEERQLESIEQNKRIEKLELLYYQLTSK